MTTTVSERFREFLDITGLTRQEFVTAVDGSITARSLFSILNGSRRPSRTLAVLIERTWGFRAEYLLDGREPAWSETGTEGLVPLSAAERNMIDFVRSSSDRAEMMRREMGLVEIWTGLFGQVLEMLAPLLEAATTDAPPAGYADAVRAAWEECMFSTRHYDNMVELIRRRRTHRLVGRFIDAFAANLPDSWHDDETRAEFDTLLRSLQRDRAEQERAISASLDAARSTLDVLAALGPAPIDIATRAADAPSAFTASLERVLASIADECDQPSPTAYALDAATLRARRRARRAEGGSPTGMLNRH